MCMKINVSKQERNKILKLIIEKNMNICAAEDLFNYCFYSTENRITNHLDGIKEFLDLDLSDKENEYYYLSRIEPAFKKLDEDKYVNNYYRQNINPTPFKSKEYQLTYLTFSPYHCFPYDDIAVKDNYVEVSRIGYFEKDYKYLAVLKNDVVWMSTDPNEINTMRDSISEAKGKVVAFGLGLGYFPIMAAVKDEVEEVVIIEKDQTIIDIFKKHILPLFEKKEKIKIIKDDAFNYLNKMKDNDVDYLFIDIWHNPEDGLPLYLKFKKMLKNRKVKVSYWLEKSILAMLRRCVLTIVEEGLEGYDDHNYQKAGNKYDKLINDLYFKTKEITIASYEDLVKILQDNELQKLI